MPMRATRSQMRNETMRIMYLPFGAPVGLHARASGCDSCRVICTSVCMMTQNSVEKIRWRTPEVVVDGGGDAVVEQYYGISVATNSSTTPSSGSGNGVVSRLPECLKRRAHRTKAVVVGPTNKLRRWGIVQGSRFAQAHRPGPGRESASANA